MKVKKGQLHPRNKHHDRYDFKKLVAAIPQLQNYIVKNKYNGDDTIDFSNEVAVKLLNQAILKTVYQISFWDFPEGNLCPPIPGRADYIHYVADLLNHSETKKEIHILDIGVGANCIYPLIGHQEYQWSFVGSDIDESSIKSAQTIIEKNNLQNNISLRWQKDRQSIFRGIIDSRDYFDFTICNPPFHTSKKAAEESAFLKNKKLGLKNNLNFQGKSNELWCPGGEVTFITKMIAESSEFKTQVNWFSSLVSSKDSLPAIYGVLKKMGSVEIKCIEMSQGQKISRFIAWHFV